MKNRLILRFILSLLMLVSALPVKSQEGSCQEWIAALKARQGRVETQLAKKVFWTTAELEDTYCFGDKLRTFQRSRATVLLRDKSYLRLNQNTITGFPKYENKEEFSLINLIKGAVFFRSRVPRRLEVETPFVNAVIKGTEFLVVVDEEQTQVTVFEGVVETTNKHGQLTLNKGETAIAKVNQPPRRHILVKPKNAVQWALYYPPVIDFRIPPSDPAASSLESALDAYRRGDLPAAFDVLNSIPEGQHSNPYFTLRSALLLTVGRVDEAEPDIARVIAENPRDVKAIALKSIIAVAQNDNEEAIALAGKAVSTDPQSAPALIALSYAQQARFELEAARESLENAVELAPDDALAWARLAELQLSFGYLDSALEAAEKAVSLNPDLERTQSVLGFAALTQIDIDKAKAAFEKAIRFDPAAPLPRLGLGLAKIRQGDLDEGTEEMEIAASLDPDNSLIRSYLGKAFYEKKDKRWAGKELAMAKELDPKDPTPWFYDAILKQTTNRPVEALHDMQKAIELNDNRAVYRSRLLLDDDLAARGTSLSRIYQDLGFGRRALTEAWHSVNINPMSYSAHRFLADSYQKENRLRISQASELLQSQLLQPTNVSPIQPALAGTNLSVLNNAGPRNLSLNEFNPLFMQNRAFLVASGVYGTNSTWGDNAILSGIYNNYSASIGQFHYETQGFQSNDDIERDLYNAYGQIAINSRFSAQFEFRSEETKAGDVGSRINGSHDTLRHQIIEQYTYRLGLRFKPNVYQDLLLSAFYTDFTEDDDTAFINVKNQIEGYQLEGQYLVNSGMLKQIFGVGYIDLNKKSVRLEKILNIQSPFTSDVRQLNGYLYIHAIFKANLSGILGLSIDSYKDATIQRTQVNPKFGIEWNPSEKLSFRAAAFRSLKRHLVANQTIEPTQVAGFNQFFDDFNGTDAWRYGFGADYRPFNNMYTGLSVSWRDTNQLKSGSSEVSNEKRDEAGHLAYLYWIPNSWSAINLEYRFDEFRRDFEIGAQNNKRPRSVSTQSVPLEFSFFPSQRFFAKFGFTYVNQHAQFVTEENDRASMGDLFKKKVNSGYTMQV